MEQQPADKNAVLRTMQVIAGALMAGVLAFGVFATMQGLAEPPDPEHTPLLSYIGAAVFFVVLPAAVLIVPAIIARAGQRKAVHSVLMAEAGPDKDLPHYATYQTMLIVRLALLEGAAFANLLALMMEHHWWSLALAGALLLVMLASFPNSGRVESFVRQQRELTDFDARHR